MKIFGAKCVLALNLLTWAANAQIEWNQYTGSAKSIPLSVLTTYVGNSGEPDNIRTKMVHLSFADLYELDANYSGGIKSTMLDIDGQVTLSVYAYDPSANNGLGGKGSLIYAVYSDETNTSDFVAKTLTTPVEIFGIPVPWIIQDVPTDQIKTLSEQTKVYINDNGTGACSEFEFNWLKGFTRLLSGNFFDLQFKECLEYYDGLQPVIIEVSIEKAELTSMKIPGVGEKSPAELFQTHEERVKNKIITRNTELSFPDNDDVKITTELYNDLSEKIDVSNSLFKIFKLQTGEEITVTSTPLPDKSFDGGSSEQVTDKSIMTEQEYQGLDPGPYGVYLEYQSQLENSNEVHLNRLYVTFFRVYQADELDTYSIVKHDYQGLPVFSLSGGFSAEYCVEKSLAALSAGISETWQVRTLENGELDLADGGPVSVYGSSDFLEKSLNKTVDLYNTHLGANTEFNTVLLGAGVPSLSYISFAMGAPYLPMHFATETNSISEVVTMVEYANDHGYQVMASAGYDPSVKNEGASWIKLLKLPQQYIDFLEDHNVQNVILVGQDENGFGESKGRRLQGKTTPEGKFDAGSVYVMTFGDLNLIKDGFKDYDYWLLEEEINTFDWESGIADIQVERFRDNLQAMTNPPDVYHMSGFESLDFYQIAINFMLHMFIKNAAIVGNDPVNSVAMNEYVIGYPAYECRKGRVPYLYWQGMPSDYVAGKVNTTLHDRILEHYPSVNFKQLPFHFNAKHDRQNFVDALQDIGFGNVTQNSWQKADVWDLNDGMAAPVEVAAKDIVEFMGGAAAFQQWVNSLSKFTIDDLINAASQEVENRQVAENHPAPASTETMVDFGSGITIEREYYNPSSYWQVKNYAKRMALHDITNGYPGVLKGYIDGAEASGYQRSQRITNIKFDLNNASDEYDLRIGYKFHPKPKDGFVSYHAAYGDEQVMDCFEYVKVPKTSWMDIPSRMMARSGAILALNGSVYDFDYNGIPGVAPFIKKDGEIMAQPQILTYKGEGAFAWDWTNKSAIIIGRPKDIPGDGLVQSLETLFQTETAAYPNVLGGMTFMTDGNYYDIESLQPQWMLDYPEFDARYLGPSGTSIRCFLAEPGGPGGPCERWLLETGGTAMAEEGWNDCSKVKLDEFAQRFSALAYRQYPKAFDAVPNSRTIVAKKGTEFYIGVVDGDLGTGAEGRGFINTKSWGMRNWELANYYKYKEYDQLVNLDGGSSSQLWMNGRGPLHDWTGYPLDADNQGPYYSRLVSSFVLLVPKAHHDQIKPFQVTNDQYLKLDNSHLNFDYNDNATVQDKAFVSLSMNLDKLNRMEQGEQGLIAGNFRVENSAEGAILFSIGEDSYYEDTEGLRTVIPRFRNLMIAGVGKIPQPLLDTLKQKKTFDPTELDSFGASLENNNQAFYYVKVYKGKVTDYLMVESGNYLDNNWHSFMIRRSGVHDIRLDGQAPEQFYLHTANHEGHMFNIDTATHAMLGGVNVDGRFVTGNAILNLDNILIIPGDEGITHFSTQEQETIESSLNSSMMLPESFNSRYYYNGVYALQFEETDGQHSFAANATQDIRIYGLNLNTERLSHGGATTRMATHKSNEDELAEEPEIDQIADLTVFPNPTYGDLTIYLPSEEGADVCVEFFDLKGNSVLSSISGCIRNEHHEIHIDDLRNRGLKPGIYVLKIYGQNRVYTNRFILSD